MRAEQITAYVERAPANWDCAATHPWRGRISPGEHLLLTMWHDLNHIEQMMHRLAGRGQ